MEDLSNLPTWLVMSSAQNYGEDVYSLRIDEYGRHFSKRKVSKEALLIRFVKVAECCLFARPISFVS